MAWIRWSVWLVAQVRPFEDPEAKILKDGVGEAFRETGVAFPWLAGGIGLAFLAALIVAWVFCRDTELSRRKNKGKPLTEDDRDPETGRYRA